MHTIAICDDNEIFCWKLESFILDYCKKIHWEVETILFTSGEELLQYWETKKRPDLLFLDIDLKSMNGISIGHEIRKSLENETTQIVFVSLKSDYAIQLFKVRPLDFLVKPVSYDDIAKILDTYCRLFVTSKPSFEYRHNKQTCRINQSNIIFLQSAGKIITVHTTLGIHQYYGKLSDCMAQLNHDCFFLVHKSFIININQIIEYKSNEILMSDYTTVPISQSRRLEFRKVILKNQIESRTI